MARFKVTHSEDACCIDIRGDIRSPEPSTAVIRFPGGHVEVSRCTDGGYWAHVHRYCEPPSEDEKAGQITDSRIDYTPEGWRKHGGAIPPIPAHEDIQHMAIKVAAA